MDNKIHINRLDTADATFSVELKSLLAWDSVSDEAVQTTVAAVLAAVKSEGDTAVVRYTNQFDRMSLASAEEFVFTSERLHQALGVISNEQRNALVAAAERIRHYHEHQKQASWQYQEEDGTVLGQQVTPLASVGLYVPGGKAAYPSSVLMNAIPAQVAGVEDIVLVTPTPDGQINEMVFAAAALAGVDKLFTVGGAQAIAALAYGTETIPKVDKIVGPGNIYVATAKQMVFGQVGLDMIAGPSEILVICDGKTDPDWIAMDLFSQAEHDENAQAILLSPDADFLEKVAQSMAKLLPTMPRENIIQASLENRGILIKVNSIDEAIEVSNKIAPEHLELSIDDPEAFLPSIKHAGAIFMGRHTAEALGDYCAGPNHVLPTSGTARFSSPLGVYDFQKRSSIIHCSPAGASTLGEIATVLAEGESLIAHARSAGYRVKST